MGIQLPAGINRVLVTGGAGFIGGAVVRRLLAETTATVFNLDKCGYASTDEVFGSLGATGRFSETTPYAPAAPLQRSRRPVLTNCSNNYGPWQFPEKLIPVVILKAAAGEPIPLYGDGANVRDWLVVEDHVDALLLAACRGTPGRAYCLGGHGERTNKQVVEAICSALDALLPAGAPHSQLTPG